MYNETRGEGLNAEVKRRILMGTYALSAGYYDAYYKRAQQVCPYNLKCCKLYVSYIYICPIGIASGCISSKKVQIVVMTMHVRIKWKHTAAASQQVC